MIDLILILILSYLAGSFPTAILAGRIVLKDDIRKHGSGNAGATNVFRVLGWRPALIVLLVDVGKGALATLVIARLGADVIPLDRILVQIFAGAAAISGHIWTVFAGFHGGKGMGTALGVLIGLAPVAALSAFGVWLVLVLTTRIVSIGSLAAGILFPVFLVLQKQVFGWDVPTPLFILGVALAVLAVITHRSNIKRLILGEENRFGSKTRQEDR